MLLEFNILIDIKKFLEQIKILNFNMSLKEFKIYFLKDKVFIYSWKIIIGLFFIIPINIFINIIIYIFNPGILRAYLHLIVNIWEINLIFINMEKRQFPK